MNKDDPEQMYGVLCEVNACLQRALNLLGDDSPESLKPAMLSIGDAIEDVRFVREKCAERVFEMRFGDYPK